MTVRLGLRIFGSCAASALAFNFGCSSKVVATSGGHDTQTLNQSQPEPGASQPPADGGASVAPVGSPPSAPRPAAPDDPYGACVLDRSDPTRAFHYVCTRGGIDCTGWGSSSVGPGCREDASCAVSEFHMVCDHTCQTDEDCPVPGTGDARPVCVSTVHACELPCDDSTTCPNGYVCQPTADWGLSSSDGNPIPLPRICMQVLTTP